MKEQLEKLVLQMYRSGIRYSEAVREFQSVFILTVLREHKANQLRAAQKLGIHRNTLRSSKGFSQATPTCGASSRLILLPFGGIPNSPGVRREC